MNFLNQKSHRPLGAIIEKGKTTFSLFAPRAERVTVTVFQNLDKPKPGTHELTRMDDGVWEMTHARDLHGWYYYFQLYSPKDGVLEGDEGEAENLKNDDGEGNGSEDPENRNMKAAGMESDALDNEPDSRDAFSARILDPYAIAAVSPSGPGIVWDKTKLTPPPGHATRGEKFTTPPWSDLIIVEAHVRDLLKNAPMELSEEERLGFTGLEKWARKKDSYLRSLGVNAVELQPIQEFGDHYAKEDYHWGYMPVNYFAPDSSYALRPERGSQIEEFQSLVKAFHNQGLAVLLDVVYNHVGNPNPLYFVDKEYYFHLDEKGNLTNWSGCGNDVRCDAPMARRLIIDSLVHFIECYDVDGFRFDLAHLIGIESLKEIELALRKVKPSVILIAEPWSFRGHIALELKDTGFASWNDGFREFVYKYLIGEGNQEGLHYYMGGSTKHLTARPTQTVNYVESHDDRCWIDKITENPEYRGDYPTMGDRRRTHLACAIMMSSLGIPMISAGQDGMRTKNGIDNSYRDGDVNAIDYQRIVEYAGTHDYFRKWIEFRRSKRGELFRLDATPPDSFFHYFGAEHGSSATAIQYNADKSQGSISLLFAINPHKTTMHIHIGKGLDLSRWKQIADHERFEERGIKTMCFRFEEGVLTLPPLSCGLWEEV
uniref:Pullulanase/glycogen debranching enzyme n=1 Tax=Candidatus Kentrum sp. SD TaxID=2126332 RepID=A0A450Y9H1_9GAMM|nr:MAG: Pullulanase/glycogen debranching enzyme [Candidatus Kentron sp. SD]VFK42978.1 MAG: Pullulanase/glycogen debranching enzyme [Candidatus Kentron sp. SD]